MAYSKQTWANGRAGNTPITAATLGHIEDGLQAAAAVADAAQPGDADLTTIAALDPSTAGVLASDGAGWIRKSYSAVKTALALVKGDVGLGNVDNTSDANKPISTATQTALDAKLAISTAAGTYVASSAPVHILGGRRWLWVGDSITNGSNAAAGRRFVEYIPHIVGSEYIAKTGAETFQSVAAGVPGEVSADTLARVPALIAANPGCKGATLLVGTNDANQSVSLATWSANVTAIIRLFRQANIPVVVGTVPPRPAAGTTPATSTTRALTAKYNMWLRLNGPDLGVQVADVHGALADPATGDMLAAYGLTDAGATGDGVHPNTKAHYAIAQAFATAISNARVMPTQAGLVRAFSQPTGFNPNPAMQGGATKPTGYFENGGGTGTAPTYSIVTDSDGVRWARMDFDGTASGGTRTLAIGTTGSYAAGDTGLLAARVKVTDLGGFATHANANPATASWTLALTDGGAAFATALSGCIMPATPGPIAAKFISVAAHTNPGLWLTVTIPTGDHVQVDLAMADAFNLTALGLA